jgi:uncharacterized transporter YbjL
VFSGLGLAQAQSTISPAFSSTSAMISVISACTSRWRARMLVTYKGLGLGAVTATLIAAVLIGQLGITISGPLKPTFFLMFLFAIGYGVGQQFVRGIAQDGIPQA